MGTSPPGDVPAVPVATTDGEWIVLRREVTDNREFDDLSAGDVFALYLRPLPG